MLHEPFDVPHDKRRLVLIDAGMCRKERIVFPLIHIKACRVVQHKRGTVRIIFIVTIDAQIREPDMCAAIVC